MVPDGANILIRVDEMTTLVPAYARDYKSNRAVQADWDADKDFRICDFHSEWDNAPMNRSQADPDEKYMVRYCGLTKVYIVK